MTFKKSNISLLWVLIFGVIFCFCKQTNAQFNPVYSFEITEISPFPSAVHGMVVDTDSTLYFSDTYTSYGDPSAVYFLEYPYTGNINATGISGNAVSGLIWQDDTLYVAFLNESKVKSYDRNFNFLSSWTVTYPWNFTSDGTDLFLVNYHGNIMKLNGNSFQTIFSGLEAPFDIVYSNNNSFFVSEQVGAGVPGRVKEISMDGIILDTIPIDFSNPEGLALDADTNLYIADTESGEVYQYTKDGEINLVTDAYNLPICIAQGQNNNILVNTNHAGGRLLDILVIADTTTGMSDLQPLQNKTKIIVSPNPNFGKFQISFNLAHEDLISIKIYDNNGTLIKDVQDDKTMAKGNHQIQVNLVGIKQGSYYVSINGKKTNVSQTIIVANS